MRGREPSATRFRGTENRGFNQIKKFLRQITPKNKLHYFSEKKKFLVIGALVQNTKSYNATQRNTTQQNAAQHNTKQNTIQFII